MEKTALSVPNPVSYMVCLGIKNVENRTWTTDYRGRLYIQSGGEYAFSQLPFANDRAYYPDEVLSQSRTILDLINRMPAEEQERRSTPEGLELYLKKKGLYNSLKYGYDFIIGWDRIADMSLDFYGIDLYDAAPEDDEETFDAEIDRAVKEKGYFLANRCIIGHADLIDIQKEYASPWAKKDSYNWIFNNPVLYKNPVIDVKEEMRLFDVSSLSFPD